MTRLLGFLEPTTSREIIDPLAVPRVTSFMQTIETRVILGHTQNLDIPEKRKLQTQRFQKVNRDTHYAMNSPVLYQPVNV